MIYFFRKKAFVNFLLIFLGLFIVPIFSFAQSPVYLDGSSLLPRAEIFTSPSKANFQVGSTFDVPIYLNTKGNNINTINLKLSFDQSKLFIVKPSFGKSIFAIWLEPPNYDNENGLASFTGVIPNGIVTDSGLIATITFKAVSVGQAEIKLTDYSSANLNDGLGSDVILNLKGSIFNIIPKKTPPSLSVLPPSSVDIIQTPIENKIPQDTHIIIQILPDKSPNDNFDSLSKLIVILLIIYLLLYFYNEIYFNKKNKDVEKAPNKIENPINSTVPNNEKNP